MTMKYLLVAILFACSSNPKVVAGEKTAAACVLGDVAGSLGSVETALAGSDYEPKLKALVDAKTITQELLDCAIKTVVAVLTAQHGNGSGASASQPSPIVVHGQEYLSHRTAQ